MKFTFLHNLCFLLLFSYSFSPLLYADYFKWELLVSEKGYGTEHLNIPIVAEGKIYLLEEVFICSMRGFWTKVESELKFYPQETLSTGLEKTIGWYLNNLDWINKIRVEKYNQERLGEI